MLACDRFLLQLHCDTNWRNKSVQSVIVALKCCRVPRTEAKREFVVIFRLEEGLLREENGVEMDKKTE